ncbi:uncharacterized protein MELLADRAFT_123856 [Melampsora larici-populina 98AG31]|uniref:Secreted protein n=1 Tax=Melampsora larici-populina (strain 98AG31 / pathotype 3-4-7) TaxID=747676 RepID=F4S9W2_MELLP|nr:uncharacterized protein MELLADRAFT_123856 [Melampsora larici-populina 98AG31]EGF98593.1 secreted protein [Melampsora larici-populina 98AG31]
MSWILSSPIFGYVFVLLLLQNLGSHMFVNANAIECNQSWQKTTPFQMCQVDSKGTYTNYACKWCGRADNGKPSATDCEGPSGKPLNTAGSFVCDVAMEYDDIKHVARPIRCTHLDTDGVARDYHCARRHLNQQCPQELCHIVNKGS